MAYIGSTPTSQNFISGTDYFNGTGSQTAFTLTRSVNSVNDVEVVINNVVQQPNSAYTINGTTITFTSAPSAGTSNIYVRYLTTTTQTIAPAQGTVNRNTLDSNLQAVCTGRNRIINGNMVVSQRYGTSSSSATDSSLSLDRWKVSINSSATVTAIQSTDAPAGFSNSLLYTVTSGSASSSTQFFGFRQGIEGYNIADLNQGTANAKTFTVSFWVKSSLTGTYAVTITNSNEDQKYPTSFTINSANTWEQKTITVTGSTTGSWVTTNGLGLSLQFYPSLGTSYRGTANAWTSSAIYGPTGLADFVATTGNTFYITGVQLEEGTQATSFERESYSVTLQKCQRYYSKLTATTRFSAYGSGYFSNTSNLNTYVKYPVPMRTAPTANFSNLEIIGNGTASAVSSISATYAGLDSALLTVVTGAVFGNYQGGVLCQNNSGSGYLDFAAEL